MINVVCISDTHRYHASIDLPPGDILIHAGDSTSTGTKEQIESVGEWLRSLTQYKYKCIIAGNHDWGFERNAKAKEWLYGTEQLAKDSGLIYLQDESVVLSIGDRSIKIYGSPWQPEFCNWAFNLPRGSQLKDKWDLIPKDIDILITHGPPFNILDRTIRGSGVGCEELLYAVSNIRPSLHVFGHIHESYGRIKLEQTTFVNASSCNLSYRPVNQPIVVQI